MHEKRSIFTATGAGLASAARPSVTLDTLDGDHLLEPLHPGLSLRSPLPGHTGDTGQPGQHQVTPDTVVIQPLTSDHHQTRGGDQEQQQLLSQQQQASNINEFQVKCGLGWKRLQTALFHCAACCVRCIGPV